MQNKSKKIISWIFLLINLSLVVYFWYSESGYKLFTGKLVSPQSISLEIGRIIGLIAMLSILVQLILIARTKFLEDAFGLNSLLKAHKWFGILSLSTVLAHVSLFMGSLYAGSLSLMFNDYVNAVLTWADLKKAALAYAALWAVAITSALIKIKSMQYRYWYIIHLLTYGVVVLAFGHQTALGKTFLKNDFAKIYWVVIFFATMAVVFYCRFLRIFINYQRHKFTVSAVIPNNKDTFSFNLKFKYPQKMNFQAGQFAKFIILQRGLWHEMHPFSFSEVSKNNLRVTVKVAGPYTEQLKAKLKIGSKVVIDGAYGKFTKDAAGNNKKILMIAGGVGVTPILAVSKKMPVGEYDRKLMYYAAQESDFIFRQELEELYDIGDIKFAASKQGGGLCDSEAVLAFARDANERIIYLCGPPPMMKFVKKELKKLGIKKSQIISEEFSF